MSFISTYLEHTLIYESPGSFWKWSAYATIAATLRDNCYRKQGDSMLFPNIYVLFLADSGQRKGRPVELSEKLIRFTNNTKVISGRTSIQAILDELNHAESSALTGQIIKGGSAIFMAPELTASIVADPATIGIMTDIYDYKSEFRHHLRSTGKLKLERIVFSMLAASNEDLLKEVYDRRALNGGLLARTFLVVPDEYRQSNSLMRVRDTTDSMKRVENELYKIANLRGEFDFTDEAVQEYEDWYIPFRNSLKEKKDKSGILGRMHTSIVKLSMILAANDLSLELKKCHMEEAIMETLRLIPNYNTFLMTGGRSTIAEAGGIVLQKLLTANEHTLSLKKIMQDHWSDFDMKVLEDLTLALEQAGFIQRISTLTQGSSIKMTEKCLNHMKGIKSGDS